MFALPIIKTKIWRRIDLIPRQERVKALKGAGYNLFRVPARDVFIDLLTDSGTSAQSDTQRSMAELADSSYAGSDSYHRMINKVKEISGFPHVLQCHQGRACEHIFNRVAITPEKNIVVGNIHFDTTRTHIEQAAGVALDFPHPSLFYSKSDFRFKGNIDLEKLKLFVAKNHKKIAYGLMTITCNSGGGQPVSWDNILKAKKLLKKFGIPLFLDATRFSVNAYFIKKYEKTHRNREIREIAKMVFNLADGFLMSARKDGLAQMGGIIALRSQDLYQKMRTLVTLYEGFVDGYGGISARDQEEITEGLEIFQDEKLLAYYIEEQVGYLGRELECRGVPVFKPFGSHAIYLDVKKFLPHLKADDLPGQALACEIYLEGGIRTCEVGGILAGKNAGGKDEQHLELLRLAVPRFTYFKDHFDYVADVVARVYQARGAIHGFEFDYEAPILRHFESTFKPQKLQT